MTRTNSQKLDDIFIEIHHIKRTINFMLQDSLAKEMNETEDIYEMVGVAHDYGYGDLADHLDKLAKKRMAILKKEEAIS